MIDQSGLGLPVRKVKGKYTGYDFALSPIKAEGAPIVYDDGVPCRPSRPPTPLERFMEKLDKIEGIITQDWSEHGWYKRIYWKLYRRTRGW